MLFQDQGAILDMMFGGEASTYDERLIRNDFRRSVKINPILRAIDARVQGMIGFVQIEKSTQIALRAEAHEALRVVGSLLFDLSKLKSKIILPSTGDEMHSFVAQAAVAYITQEPIPLFTPCCPDWSQDLQGRYDFKFLGGEASLIAKKFLAYAPEFLVIFAKHNIPYQGTLIAANWGYETELKVRGMDGRMLTSEQIQQCFLSTARKTDELLTAVQAEDQQELLTSFRVISMIDFFQEQAVDPIAIDRYLAIQACFPADKKAAKLADQLHTASFTMNSRRFGYSEEENRLHCLQTLAEYATLGEAFGESGIVISAESHTSTKGYNLSRTNKLPVFYVKGHGGISEGVNIL